MAAIMLEISSGMFKSAFCFLLRLLQSSALFAETAQLPAEINRYHPCLVLPASLSPLQFFDGLLIRPCRCLHDIIETPQHALAVKRLERLEPTGS